jgi:hypothetical protein
VFAHRSHTRRTDARLVRDQASELASEYPYPPPVNNGEEVDYRQAGSPSYVANYSKGLRHNALGEVLPRSYESLLDALDSRDPQQFERIQLGHPHGGLNLINPQAGLAFDLEGPDAMALAVPPAPRIDGPEASGEMGELYWMALLRDVAFVDYGTGANTDADPIINTTDAAAAMTADFSVFRGPRVGNAVTPDTLFRGSTREDSVGPYLSQFLLLGNADPILGPAPSDGFIKYGTLRIDQRQKTAAPNVNYLTSFNTGPQHWLGAQNGRDYRDLDQFDSQRRFIRNLRDLATYVHFDALYEAYLNACLILLGMRVPFDSGNPYVRSRTQDGFGTFGGPHILSLVTEVATRALKAVWYQKWGVHRRLRPEEYGGRLYVHRDTATLGRYPFIDDEILASSVLNLVEGQPSGSALLPQAFPEGAPTHPAYGAGHATVAGACVTVLKAFFDESFVIPTPRIAARDGLSLLPLPAGTVLTVRGELNKLAANISLGRNAAGVHWRSDYAQSVLFGEKIALGILREQKLTYNEDHHLTVTRFDGTAVVI